MGHSLRRSSISPVSNRPVLEQPDPIRLGSSHLDENGLSTAWVMREVGRMHWMSVWDAIGMPPSECTNCQGSGLTATVRAATLTGTTTAFRKGTDCQLRMVAPPTKDSMWLSQTDLETTTGERLCVEVMSTFAPPQEAAAHKQQPNEAPFDTSASAMPARRADILRKLGKLELHRANEHNALPQMSIPISSRDHLNVGGKVCFSAFQEFFASAESRAMLNISVDAQLVARRVHYYANPDIHDTLDIVTDITTNVHNLPAWLLAFSFTRSRLDGQIVAACESSYRMRPLS